MANDQSTGDDTSSQPNPFAPQQNSWFGSLGGPPQNPNAPGAFMSQGNGYFLTNLGANILNAADERTSGGFLAHPSGLGVLGAGLATTQAQGRAGLSQQADLAFKNAQTIGEQNKNRLANIQFPSEAARAKYMQQYWANLPSQTGADTTATSTSTDATTTQPPPVGGPFVAKNLPAWVTPEEDAVVRTVYGEARGESPEGQQAVASVIANRASDSGMSRSDVVYAPGQFEPWNNAKTRPMLEKLDPNSKEYQTVFSNILPVLQGQANDPTNGSTHFYSPTAQAALGRQAPDWAAGQTPEVTIGGHQFYKLGYPGPSNVAGKPPAPAPQASAAPSGPGSPSVASAAPSSQPGVPPTQQGPSVASNQPAASQGLPSQARTAMIRGNQQAQADAQQVQAQQPPQGQQGGTQPTFKPYQVAGNSWQPPPSSSNPNIRPVREDGGTTVASAPAQAAPQRQPVQQPVQQPQQPVQQPQQPVNAAQQAANDAAPHAARRDQLMQQAAALEQAQKSWTVQQQFASQNGAPFLKPYPAGDPALLRQQANDENRAVIELSSAYSKAQATGAGGAPTKLTSGRPGSVITDANGNIVQGVPYPKQYVTASGVPYQMLVDPTNDKPIIGADAGKQKPDADIPPGGTRSGLSPTEQKRQEQDVELTTGDINEDRKVVEEENEHIIGTAFSAKQQALQLKALAPAAYTGAMGDVRAIGRAYVQQFAPEAVSQFFGADAAPAQEFNKIALMSAGTQERENLGAKGGLGATQLYLKNNPSNDITEVANGHMANVLAVRQQAAIDYGTGVSGYYETNRDAYHNSGGSTPYGRIPAYDNRFTSIFNADTYRASMDAMNGKPEAVWAAGLKPVQRQAVIGIIQRTDPTQKFSMGGAYGTADDFINRGALVVTPQDIQTQSFPINGKLSLKPTSSGASNGQ